MSLTADLVASVPQVLEDAGPRPTAAQMADEDYEVFVRATLTQRTPGALWVFAYGSLLWNPACEVAEVRAAIVQGWHRAFCFRSGFRGTVERPGLMMGLDRGGQCQGMVLRIPSETVEENLGKLFRRELLTKPPVYVPRWLTARTSDGPVQALGFVVNRQHERYVGRLALDNVAALLSTAAGPHGSCAEYLYNTVAHLEELGIRDRNLWHLQKLVAERIAKAHRG
jgi:glutathione-specific gamma-glutamylcyclotransferase